ncbi:MAG TPA: hypothetical protein VMG41_09095 [Gemmatimonadales bacterium]|nr:hypothetical protein [Gemmatimonadales bacterium]
MSGTLSLYAVTAPGLELLAAAELEALGLPPSGIEPGGVSFSGTLLDLARANLWLRTASRVLLRLGSFRARALGELERKSGELPWQAWLPPGARITVRVTSRKSRLFHQKAIGERIARAARGQSGPQSDDTTAPELVVVRLLRDECLVSLDSSGELLHRRGYRLQTGKAPLRETLAAALILASGWWPEQPLVDPFAGSGTIPIEAARIARRLPPGLDRAFAFRRWSAWDDREWRTLVDAARAASLARAPAPIVAADRDAGAVAAGRENAGRAGVLNDVEFREAALSSLAFPESSGAVVTNPPYGVRVGASRQLRDLYARLGQVALRLRDWSVTMLVPGHPFERATGLPFRELFRTTNGGLLVRALHWRGVEVDA